MSDDPAPPREISPPDPALVLASAYDAILTKTTDGVITSWNSGAERLYGYTPEEVVGRHVRILVPPDRHAELEQVIAQVSGGEAVDRLETERVTKDGRRVRLSLAISPIRDASGAVMGISAIGRDITAQVAAEEELHRTAETLRAIVEASPVATKILDLDGRVQYWSSAAEAMLGWAAEEVLGDFPPTVPPDELDRHQDLRTRVASGELVVAQEASRLRRDGTRLEVLVYSGPRRSVSGEIVGVVELLADVTAHRELERQLLQAQKLEGIGRLAGGVAHDFNNVLTAILGHAALLLEGDEDSPAVHARAIRGAAERGAGLTAQLLAFSRRQVLQPRILDLDAEVRSSEVLVRPLIGETIELRIVPRGDTGHILADPTQLQQVILNLAVNARDAMPDGGRLTIETDAADFNEAYASEHFDVQPGRYSVLVVSDTGTGMDRETRQHIFEPFFTTKPAGLGTGLGLATTYGIVRQSGGHVWLYSEPGVGTTFKIYFPLVTPAGEPTAVPPAPPMEEGSGTILLVEDDDEVRQIERRLLERLGYRVLTAENGAEALSFARAEGLRQIDLLMTDVVMPRMSGLELAASLRADRADLPVLFLSGYAEEMVGRGGLLPQGTAFLGKPFTPDSLARQVKTLLAEAGGLREAEGPGGGRADAGAPLTGRSGTDGGA